MTKLKVVFVISPPQFIPEIRMSDGDERFCSFRERLAPQIGNAILGDDRSEEHTSELQSL
jgi:hypothetical protein